MKKFVILYIIARMIDYEAKSTLGTQIKTISTRGINRRISVHINII